MAGVIRIFGRRSACLLRQTSFLVTRRSNMVTKTAYEEMAQFWSKNRQLARPLSPFLSIYGYHMTMLISISSRVMAIGMQVIISGVACALTVVPVNFTEIMKWIKNLNLNPAVIIGCKYIIATPPIYHLFCGCRHLMWDAGLGYKFPTIIKGGYFIFAITALTASAVVFGVKPSML